MRRQRFGPPPKKPKIDSSLAIVNIVLLLIFFFLATGSLNASRTIVVALPETTVLPLDVLPQPLLVIEENGDLLLNDEPIAAGQLNGLLIDDPVLHVLADGSANAWRILDILDREGLIAVEIKLVTVHRSGKSNE